MVGAGVAGSALAYKQGKVSVQALINDLETEHETPSLHTTLIAVGIAVIVP